MSYRRFHPENSTVPLLELADPLRVGAVKAPFHGEQLLSSGFSGMAAQLIARYGWLLRWL